MRSIQIELDCKKKENTINELKRRIKEHMNNELNMCSEETIPKNSYVENNYYSSMNTVENNEENIGTPYNFKKKNMSSAKSRNQPEDRTASKKNGASNIENTMAKRFSVASKSTQGQKSVSYKLWPRILSN